MSDEPLVPSATAPALPAQGDYEAICAALMRTERGRWFLHEFATRNRHADTETLLTAIRRIEAVVRANSAQQARQSFRSELLEMANAITHTRAEVDGARQSDGPAPVAPETPHAADVFAAAARIRDVTWAMRGHGFDPAVCAQLEELAASILSASSLREPGDRRARELSDVLQYLEHRIEALLDGLGATQPGADSDHDGADAAARSGTLVSAEILRSPQPGAIARALESAPPPSSSGRIQLRSVAPQSLPSVRREPASLPANAVESATTPDPGAMATAALRQDAAPPAAQPDAPPQARPPAGPDAEAAVAAPAMPPMHDPLAPLDAMSEEERLALFT